MLAAVRRRRRLLRGGASAAAFSPSGLTDLRYWNDPSLSAQVQTDGCAQFTAASSESLSAVDAAAFDPGTYGEWFSAWVRFDALATSQTLLGKWTVTGNQREFMIYYSASLNRITFWVSGNGTLESLVHANVLGAPSANTWYHVFCWHDPAADTINIRVNGGAADSLAHSAGRHNGTGVFYLGRWDGGDYLGGRLDNVCWGRPAAASPDWSTICTRLYNGGSGLAYADSTAQERTDWGVVSWWKLNERSGTRSDSHGSTSLTDNNTVVEQSGKVVEVVAANDPVYRCLDQSGGGRHLTAPLDWSTRPDYKTGIINGLAVVRGTGTPYRMQSAAGLLGTVSGFTVMMVAQMRSTVGTQTFWGASNANYASSYSVLYLIGGAWVFEVNNGTVTVTVTGPAPDTNAHVFEAVFEGGGTNRLLIDGTEYTASAAAVASLTLGQEFDLLHLDNGGSPLHYGNIEIAETVVWLGHASADRANCRAYLKAKWGTP